MTTKEKLEIQIELLTKENEALKCRCKTLCQGVLCEICPLECRYRPGGYMDKIKAEIYENGEDN